MLTERIFCFTEFVEDIDLLIRKAERCLEAGADTIMIDADDVCKYADSLRADIIAKVIGRLGIEKTMFEASDAKLAEWFIKRYGPNVFADTPLYYFYLLFEWLPSQDSCLLVFVLSGESLCGSFSDYGSRVPPWSSFG